MYDFLIIGGGVIGCSIARVLSRFQEKTILLEKNCDVAMGATGANSGILHAGHDCEYGTLMAKFNVEGNIMFDEWAKDLEVPISRSGTLVLAFDENEKEKLQDLYQRGIKNGVEGIEIISKDRILEMEPNINDNVVAALWTPTGGMINPYELNVALYENAKENGVDFVFNSEVVNIEYSEGYFTVKDKNGKIFHSKKIINAAGVYADKMAKLIGDKSFEITARRGEYVIFDRPSPVNRPIFQVPTKLGKGVLVSPTVDGNFFIGPSALNLQDKDDKDISSAGLKLIKEAATKSVSELPYDKQISVFAGIRAVPNTGDFVIGKSSVNADFINVAGICSPGLTSAPAIAEYVIKMFSLKQKNNYKKTRQAIPSFKKADIETKKNLIAADKRYSEIVCRCEIITEAEIVEAIKRGATTVDGIKRRTRATMGRCQGSFCVPRIIEIMSRELKIPMEEITKFGGDSTYIYGDIRGKQNEC